MQRIHILTAKGCEESLIFLTPLLMNRGLLKEMGITIKLFYRDDATLYDADCVIFENRIYRRWGREAQDRKAYELLEKLNRRVDKVFWFDNTDGTGTTQFQFLPYVHGYFKTQILRDKSQYTKPYYGGRIYTDFYHSNFGVNDSNEWNSVMPAKESDLHKIRLAWNDSLGDFGPWGKYVRRLRTHFPVPMFYSAKFSKQGNRSVDVNARFGTAYSRETVAFQRHMVKQVLNKLDIPTDKIPKTSYLRQLRNSKIAVSPFGWGEPSYRDYEIIINGAMLLKPDMSHLATWPDLYLAGETYLPYKWDCSDLESVLEDALESGSWCQIASQAQEVYHQHLFSQESAEEFCIRLREICN